MATEITINERTLAGETGDSLFECAERLGVQVPTSCRKNGKCRECLVEVVSGMDHLSAKSPEEAHLAGRYRLACRATVARPDGKVQCQTLRRGALRIEADSSGLPFDFQSISLQPAVRREGETVLLDSQPVATSRGPLLGAAVDIGTTTVVLRVIDLESGQLVAGAAFENPQRFGGSDVMARIAFDSENPGRLLQRTVLGYLAQALQDLPVDAGSIYEMVVVGNPTMRDLFFGLDVSPIGQRPYQSITERAVREGLRSSTTIESTGEKLRLPIHPAARVVGLPLVGSHVGADAAACMLAVGMQREDSVVVIMDIGTNTEIACGRRGRMMAASCPAGPAFEGGRISCGMPAMDGAIERVRLEGGNEPVCAVIGSSAASGICGSGIVDALSEFRRCGIMNVLGRFENEQSRFVVDPARDIYLSEADINELAQAKAANMAGLSVLLSRFGIALEQIEVFYLAGGFARHLDVDAAKRIGLVPDLPNERFRKIGNAAIEGACLALCSTEQRAALEEMVKSVEHVELETDPHFFDHFVEGCHFDYFGSTERPAPA